MKTCCISILFGVLALFGLSAQSQPDVKVRVVNFTADWCPSCRIFDPRLHKALDELNDPSFEQISIDLTVTKTGSMDQRTKFWDGLPGYLETRHIGRLHSGFMGFRNTGYAVVIAADTQEPLFCTMGPIAVEDLKFGLLEAKRRVVERKPHDRVPEGADCPPSYLN